VKRERFQYLQLETRKTADAFSEQSKLATGDWLLPAAIEDHFLCPTD